MKVTDRAQFACRILHRYFGRIARAGRCRLRSFDRYEFRRYAI
ncbi:hypothetical protein BSIN_0952 [Burkholderia singularis]|uniref:Uncharacterized protein n=1 Tax=Burkholderia singularis TaxID=1503053 RepID=A0A238HB16_9BURK|nr:hypothetical protein BSIN_0952 [Burkholderia singularis]